MESANGSPTIDQISELVVRKLTQGGELADLAHSDLLTIENETLNQVDQVTRKVISVLLGKQGEVAARPEACPRCGGVLREKPSQGRSMQSKRGTVHFKTEVFRCEACRLDFFPSVQNSRL